MIGIKICGITNVGDARSAVEYGVDALGFIFYPKSKRYVSPGKAREMIRELPCEVIRVGVFVNQEIGEVKKIARFCNLSLIQLHGDESPQYCGQLSGFSLIKAISPRTEAEVLRLGDYPVGAILVDAYEQGRYGGTGKTSDWRLAIKVKERYPIILSGGLNADNIREAIEAVKPQAVDINSGVEISPGKKDPDKIREIVEIARGTEPALDEGFFRRGEGPS
jgi:phosphoribosylanthranilate isomerase